VPKPIDTVCLFEVLDQALSQAPTEARAIA